MLAVLLAGVTLLSGCGDDTEPLTENNIQQRVTDAMREAGTFHFTWASVPAQETWSGRIRYDEQGKIDALAMKSSEEVYRIIGTEGYHKYTGGEFHAMDAEETRDVIRSWDIAPVLENFMNVTEVTQRGEGSVDGVSATRYEVTISTKGSKTRFSGTWWVTDDDRLVKGKLRGRDDDDDRVGWTATYTDYGEPIDVAVPVKSG